MKKPAYAREYKKFGIRHAHKPQAGHALAGVVQVADENGKGYLYVRFAEELVQAVGRVMAYGVGPEHPCYLRVLHLRKLDVWRVFAYYLDNSQSVLLWEAVKKPEWLKQIRRGANESTS